MADRAFHLADPGSIVYSIQFNSIIYYSKASKKKEFNVLQMCASCVQSLVTLSDYIGQKNHQKIIVIGQTIGSGKIDSFM